MKVFIKLYFMLIFLLFYGCKGKEHIRPIISDEGKHIGDSVFVDNRLFKIIFSDSTYYIDSIIFERNRNNLDRLSSIKTFMNGKNVFENIFYYSNGSIKTYLFIDDSNANYFFRRDYDSNGLISNDEGKIFFQGYLDKINPETLEVKDDNKRMEIKVFYPNPPLGNSFLYIDLDSQKADVFKQNKYIPFLKQVWVDTKTKEKIWTEINICLEIKGLLKETLFYNRPIYYKAVK